MCLFLTFLCEFLKCELTKMRVALLFIMTLLYGCLLGNLTVLGTEFVLQTDRAFSTATFLILKSLSQSITFFTKKPSNDFCLKSGWKHSFLEPTFPYMICQTWDHLVPLSSVTSFTAPALKTRWAHSCLRAFAHVPFSVLWMISQVHTWPCFLLFSTTISSDRTFLTTQTKVTTISRNPLSGYPLFINS